MGIEVQYYAISTEMMNLYHSNDIEKFYDELERLKETIYHCDLIKLWDILHYLCTGFTANDYHKPVKKLGFLNKLKSVFVNSSNDNDADIFATEKQKYLYYAFYGKNIPVTDDTSFNNYDDIIKITPYLKAIDIKKMITSIDYQKIPFDKLYPKLSLDDFNDDEFINELIEFFEKFKTFYQNALKNNRCVCVMIG